MGHYVQSNRVNGRLIKVKGLYESLNVKCEVENALGNVHLEKRECPYLDMWGNK